MQTLCKFRCTSVETVETNDRSEPLAHSAKFVAVSADGSPENKQFFKYTPTGNLQVGTTRVKFEAGREYYLLLSEENPVGPQPA